MEPTNSLLLATEMHTPICLPGRISLLLHCKRKMHHVSKGCFVFDLFFSHPDNSKLTTLSKHLFFRLWRQKTHQLDSLLCSFFSAESDKGIASVQATERIHHQTQVPDWASFLKEWNKLILKKVSRDFSYKYL